MTKVSAEAARLIVQRNELTLNKHDLSELLYLYVQGANGTTEEEQLFSQRFRDSFTKQASGFLIDAVFGVASRHTKIDGSEPTQIGQRKKEGDVDGLIANHLLQAPVEEEEGMKYPKVTLPSFGTFLLVERAEREGVHPDPLRTDRILIPKTCVISFRPGKALKAAAASLELK
jgi:hypothetical protein